MAAPVLEVLAHFGIQSEIGSGQAHFCCPFHAEDTASCGMRLDSGSYHCFGCDAGGDLISFVAAMDGGDRFKAMQLVRGIKTGKLNGAAKTIVHRQQREAAMREGRVEYSVVEQWTRFHKVNWHAVSKSMPVADYLFKRGFRRSTLDAFDVRLSEREGYPIVIPIRQGKTLVGYCYRRVDNEGKKYLYNSGFKAAEHLGFYRVNASPCVVVEGMLDLMMCAQYGAGQGAAILSWHMSDFHAKWLKEQGIREFVCALDNTPTGDKGFARMKEVLPTVYRFKFQGKYRKDVGELSINEFHFGLP